MGETFLDPLSIRFSQDTISEHFKVRAELVRCRVNCCYAVMPAFLSLFYTCFGDLVLLAY